MKYRQRKRLERELEHREYRHAFFDEMIATTLAAQIRANRKARGWSQQQLAERADMKQSRISALEDVNYRGWTLKTLRRLAEAFDVALTVRFESFETALERFEQFEHQLVQPAFDEDSSSRHESRVEPAEAQPAGRTL